MKGLTSHKGVVLFICCIFLVSCTKEIDRSDITLLNNEKQILEFKFLEEENDQLDSNITANIDEETKVISVVLPNGTKVTTLKPEIIVSQTASIVQDIEVSLDFSAPIIYSIVAEDGSIADYTVKVRVIASSPREVLSTFFEQNPDNTLGWNIENEDIATWDGVIVVDNKVVALELAEKGLTVLPPEICDLFYLRTMFLEKNMITKIPVEIEDLSNNLRTLNLGENQIETIPEEFFSLKKLINLKMHTNLLREIPSDINKLKALRELNVSNNSLRTVPIELFELTQLNSLFLNNIKLTKVPSEIVKLSQLTSLGLSGNPIGEISDPILGLESLTRLDMYNANISVIPSDIRKLTKLKRLQLSRNNLTEINESISDVFMLEFLFLNINTIEQIPTKISNLIHLKTLDIKENTFVTIPNAVCDLANTGTEILIDEHVTCGL